MSARGLPGRRVEENRAGMTATAVAGDRVTDPALCSTGNSSTRTRRPSAVGRRPSRRPCHDDWPTGRVPKAAYDRPMSKPVLAVGLLATMAGAWYWALLPAAQLVVAPAGVRRAAARAPRAVPAVRLADLAVEAASPADARRRGAIRSRMESPVALASDSRAAAGAPRAPPPCASARRAGVATPRLIGVAEARDGSGLVRTAIVSGPHGVHHARAGDLLEQVYRVERIGGDGVDVRLLPEDRMLRLALRAAEAYNRPARRAPARATHQVGARRSQLRCRHGLHPVCNCF